MTRELRGRFWAEAGLALISGALVVITLVWRDWIEIAFGIDPDEGNGSVEWLIVAVFLAITLVSVVLSRLEWRRTAAYRR
jgi:DMSO/TMAO reductase YedYZ heme-binding membrane subunit